MRQADCHLLFNIEKNLSILFIRDTPLLGRGGKAAIKKQHERNKLTARERIKYLCDADKPFIEMGAFAGYW